MDNIRSRASTHNHYQEYKNQYLPMNVQFIRNLVMHNFQLCVNILHKILTVNTGSMFYVDGLNVPIYLFQNIKG